jgi:hypothetical protein
MSDTPKTDAAAHTAFAGVSTDYGGYVNMLNHARTLERELATAIIERDNALSDHRQADTDSLRALHERNKFLQQLKEAQLAIIALNDYVRHTKWCISQQVEEPEECNCGMPFAWIRAMRIAKTKL